MAIQKTIYALLVGINKYSRLRGLDGCINDIKTVRTYLEGRISGKENIKVDVHELTNQDATYEAIVNGFRTHLTKAGKDDVALFYFSGHGAKEKSPKELIDLNPDGYNESLACYDSYAQPGVWGLADKDIRVLLNEIGKNEPHITVILDCCHSGSGTRDTAQMENKVRLTSLPEGWEERPLDSYLFTKGKRNINLGELPPDAKHVVLSACRDSELAIETTRGGEQQGIFSYYLNATLEATKQSLGYRDIVSLVKARIESIENQHPQVEALGGANINQAFLGGEILERGSYVVSFHADKKQWFVNAGSVHGLGVLGESTGTELALFDINTSKEGLSEATKAKAFAEVMNVLPHKSF